jgi:hypothetical protein
MSPSPNHFTLFATFSFGPQFSTLAFSRVTLLSGALAQKFFTEEYEQYSAKIIYLFSFLRKSSLGKEKKIFHFR